MLITAFEKKGQKVLVHFENGIKLLLNYEIFLKNGLKLNNDLAEDRFSFIQEENIKYEIKHSAFNILSRRIHSTAELRTKLKAKYHHPAYVDEIIDHLLVNNYLDDEKYVREFITEKTKSKLWGSRKIKAELIKRGIDGKIVAQCLPHEDEESGLNFLKAACEKKLNSLRHRNYPDDKLRQKLISYLLAKGFEYDEIKRVVTSSVSGSEEEYD